MIDLVLRILIISLWTPIVISNSQETLIGITGKDFVLLGADSSRSGSIAWMGHQFDKISLVGQNVGVAAVGDAADTDRMVGLLDAHSTLCEYESSLGYDLEYYYNSGEDDRNNNNNMIQQKDPSIVGLSVEEVAQFARNQISELLRSSGRLDVCLLIAGFSDSIEETDIGYFTRRLQDQVLIATNQPIQKSSSSYFSKEFRKPRLYWIDQYGSLQSLPYGVHGLASNFLLSILDQGYKENMSKEEAIGLMNACFEQLRTRYIIHSPTPPIIKCLDQDGCRIVS
jgi:20S proteasome alpha/beta subunit